MTRICTSSTLPRQRSDVSLLTVGALQAMVTGHGASTVSQDEFNLDASWNMNLEASLRFRANSPSKASVTQTQVASMPAATEWVQCTPIVVTQFVSVPVVAAVPVAVTPVFLTPLVAVAAQPVPVSVTSSAPVPAAVKRTVYDISGEVVVETGVARTGVTVGRPRLNGNLASIFEALVPQAKPTEEKGKGVASADDTVQPPVESTNARDRLRDLIATGGGDGSSSVSDMSTFSDLWV
eukprot:Protomagalhaensia_sp_Gyna_25__2451@NODE_2368_length_1124_cov_1476_569585_g1963_i0_p1_GENE_NODE_2368_length_1124_cov_1476_569585_g1963_i0NODE_2368_length_1124_cov_1476_569585_g1963_i0_p1_ORF_typecomplete_len237_score39_47_NODE_2368_length_1124_cov_1476_569585_g1963_i0200910